MNVFVIPSWYPSADDPQIGIFTLEQKVALARAYPNSNFGISTWGQNEEARLLWAKDALKNVFKLIKGRPEKPSQRKLASNLWEYYTPSFTWSDKVFAGNITSIIRANDHNLQKFILQTRGISLLHAHTSFPAGYIAWQLAKKYQLPFVITEHMSPFPFDVYMEGGKIKQKVMQPLLAATAVIANSPFAAHEIEVKTGIRPRMIPNLVDEELFSPSVFHRITNDGTFNFFSLGRIVPQKGYPDLLKAISLMQHTNVQFRIGGSGEHMQEYQTLAQQLGVADKISWLGELSREQVVAEFTYCHAFVLASLHESMGVAYAEALACGKPIIATRSGGPEFIVTPQNGLLVDIQAPVQLATAMDTLIQGHASYSPDQIRCGFLDKFSSRVITKEIYALYESILNK